MAAGEGGPKIHICQEVFCYPTLRPILAAFYQVKWTADLVKSVGGGMAKFVQADTPQGVTALP